ncbi:MAG: glycosyltransferase family 39 protein [Flavobacteriales bacterium]
MSIRTYIKRNKFEFIFGGVLMVMMFAYSFPYVLQQGPKGFHIWRQTDGLSFARHYYDNGLDFSDPQISHLLFNDHTSAKTVGEFPGVYYFVAVLWKIFGIHEWIFRLVTLLISFAGLLAAHRLIRELIHQPFWSTWIVALLFTSPAVVFYSVGFIPDMHAIGFSLMACYFFYRYAQSRKIWLLYFTAFLFALAGVIKPTALIPFAALGAILILEMIQSNGKNTVIWFHSKMHACFAFGSVVALNLGWIIWVRHYNNSFGGWFTPHDVFLPWHYSDQVMRNFLSMFREFLVNQLFSRITLFLLISILVLLLFSWKFLEKRARSIFLLVVLGSTAYALLFFKWDVHDYYALVLIPLPLTLFVIAIRTLANHQSAILNWRPLRYFAILFLIYNIWYCTSNMQMRVNPKSEKLYLSSASEPEVDLFKYLMWSYDRKFAAMTEFEAYLKSWGINENDLIVSLPDDSFNASLYLMHRRGWTSYESDVYTKTGMNLRIERGAKFLVVNDLEAAKGMGLPDHFISEKVGEYKNLIVFKLPDTIH